MSGELEVFVANEQDDVPIAEDLFYTLAKAIAINEYRVRPAELSVLFVDRDVIASMNLEFRAMNGPTDVLSFVIEEDDPPFGGSPDSRRPTPTSPQLERPALLGDIVICPLVAAENAAQHEGERGHDGTIEDELALLLVHGVLHLKGMDHEIDAEAELMEAREDELLEQFYRPLKAERLGRGRE
ncbi:rRNA maturation RNase YbeY [Ferrimicrobium sp.]|uniref:rRNA maturation RNase YbeY n=1 Tax=Ferrimicrobium sp. TaxID=2926050 RepID=UPI00260FF182|nr:rRNA maturation RNase YbeY [Ferrimicrobium sp.]